jgi:hypothetical protein
MLQTLKTCLRTTTVKPGGISESGVAGVVVVAGLKVVVLWSVFEVLNMWEVSIEGSHIFLNQQHTS